MRYRLRTLLIVVTIAGLCFGWIAHSRRMAEHHLRMAAKISSSITQNGRIEQNEAAQALNVLAARDADVITVYDEKRKIAYVRIGNSTGSMLLNLPQAAASDWERVGYHRKMALRYDRAAFRPWVFWSEYAIAMPRVSTEEVIAQPSQPVQPKINFPVSELKTPSELLKEFRPNDDLRHLLPDPNAL